MATEQEQCHDRVEEATPAASRSTSALATTALAVVATVLVGAATLTAFEVGRPTLGAGFLVSTLVFVGATGLYELAGRYRN